MNKEELLKIGIQKRNKETNLTWQEIAERYGGEFFTDGETLRSWVKNQVLRKGDRVTSKEAKKDENENAFKETVEFHKDGKQTSSKLIQMSEEDKKSPTYLLEAHGYDSNEWELVDGKSSIWTGYSKVHGQFPMYASKITVKPLRVTGLAKVTESIKYTKPIYIDIKYTVQEDKKMLEIPLFDPHFGICDYEYYKPTQMKIHRKLNTIRWEEVVFIIGQDLFHNNDHRGRTANGTPIQVVDMEKTWEDARMFYEPLIEAALVNSNSVKIIYSKGNHDETISWAFVKFLAARFPQAKVDDSFVERKIHTFGKNFIGITHGDKARKNLHNIFPVEFPQEWANSTNREIHIGHLHTEDAKDWFGTVVRTLATRNKTDQWHKDNGFVGAHKRFMLFEYSEEDLESIHYV